MSIIGKIEELNSLTSEIKSLRKRISFLNKQKKDVESYICNYIKNENPHGLKYNNVTLKTEPSIKRNRKRKNDQQKDAENVLRSYGISDPETVLRNVLNARRGSETESEKLIIKKKK